MIPLRVDDAKPIAELEFIVLGRRLPHRFFAVEPNLTVDATVQRLFP